MAYSIKIKNEVIKRIDTGEKVKDISEEMGISVPTIYRWRKNFQLDKQNIDNIVLDEQKETSKEIKKLIELKKFDKALKYTDKYPFNPVIQSQKIKIYIKKGKYKEAKEIGERFRDNAVIQSQMIIIAIKEGDFKTAKEIGERFRDNAAIQSQMITIAIEEGDIKTAKDIGEKFKDYAAIQSQMVTIAIEEGDIKTAKDIGKKFKDYATIQSQMVTIAIEEGNIKTAKEIGKRFKDDPVIQSQMVTIAIKEGDFKTAKEIGKQFKDNPKIQSQMIIIAIEEGDFETAEKIGKRFKNDPVIQLQVAKDKLFYKQIEDDEIKNIGFLNKIKTKIYYELEKIDIQEILQNDELTEQQKLYITLAIYEKRKNIKGIQELAKQYKESNESKNINIILQRAQSKKKQIFDWAIYDEHLQWELDEELKNEYEQKQKENRIKQREIEQNVKTDNSIELKKASKENFKQKMQVQVQHNPVEINNRNKKKQLAHYYKEVLTFLLEKRKTIYVKMQSKDLKTQREGISQWDKLEDLIKKTKEQKENIDYISTLYQKVTKLREKEEKQLSTK